MLNRLEIGRVWPRAKAEFWSTWRSNNKRISDRVKTTNTYSIYTVRHYYSVIRSMLRWTHLNNFQIMMMIASMEKDSFMTNKMLQVDVMEEIEWWYDRSYTIGESECCQVDIRSAGHTVTLGNQYPESKGEPVEIIEIADDSDEEARKDNKEIINLTGDDTCSNRKAKRTKTSSTDETSLLTNVVRMNNGARAAVRDIRRVLGYGNGSAYMPIDEAKRLFNAMDDYPSIEPPTCVKNEKVRKYSDSRKCLGKCAENLT
jgi:hypothetical protein